MDGDGKSIVGLAGSKSESALVLKTPATPSDMVTLRAASDGIGRGLILSSSSVAQAGTVITPDGGMVWVGDWLPQTQGRGPGFFVVRDKERGVAVSVRDKEKSPGILLSGEVDVATIQIRSRESGDVAFATKDGVGSAMVIKDASGKEVVRLPAR
jgi:hypothetical protein